MDTTSSKTIVNSIPTTATPYVKVSMTGGSSTITATPSVNTKGYGSTASGGYSVASSGTKTVSVDNKTLYIPIKESTAANSTISAQGGTYKIPVGYVSSEKTITASLPNASLSGGGLTLTTAGSTSSTITTAPTYNSTSGKYEYSISATRAKVTNGTSGYLSSGDKIGATTSSSKIQLDKSSVSTNTITTQGGTATISAGYLASEQIITANINSASQSSNVSLSTSSVASNLTSTTGSISGITNAASSTGTTSVPSSGVYVKVSHTPSATSVSATPSISVSTAGYVSSGSTGSAKSVTISKASDLYVPIKTTTVNLPSSLSKNPTVSKVEINKSTGVVTATATNEGTCNVTTSLNNSSAGWVATAPSGNISISGSNTGTLNLGVATLDKTTITTQGGTAKISAGYLAEEKTITANIPYVDIRDVENTLSLIHI